jgi:hypothetical protein
MLEIDPQTQPDPHTRRPLHSASRFFLLLLLLLSSSAAAPTGAPGDETGELAHPPERAISGPDSHSRRAVGTNDLANLPFILRRHSTCSNLHCLYVVLRMRLCFLLFINSHYWDLG